MEHIFKFSGLQSKDFFWSVLLPHVLWWKRKVHTVTKGKYVPTCKCTCIGLAVVVVWVIGIWLYGLTLFPNLPMKLFNVPLFLHHHMDEDTQCVQFDWIHLILEYIQFCPYTFLLPERQWLKKCIPYQHITAINQSSSSAILKMKWIHSSILCNCSARRNAVT